METRLGNLEVSYSARGNPTYTLELWHDGLKKHRLIRGNSTSIVQLKAKLQIEEWEQKWDGVIGKRQQADRKSEAIDKTSEAQQELELLASLLKATLNVDDRIDWESLKDKTSFPEPKPKAKKLPAEPVLQILPREPKSTELKYKPKFGLLDKLFSSRRLRVEEDVAKRFSTDVADWTLQMSDMQRANNAAIANHEKKLHDILVEHSSEVGAWEVRKKSFLVLQAAGNAVVDTKQMAYEAGQSEAIIEHIDLVLSSSRYPDYFPQEFDIEYDSAAKTAIIDYQLPSPDDLPKLRAVKYIASRDEFEEQFITDPQAARQYDDVLYQVVLRTVHELFEADVIGALEAIVLNGIVSAIDRTTGKLVTACVLSLRAGKSEFSSINLAQVDPKACFKSLKGVGSSKLSGLSAVPPIMQLRRDDGRFVSSYEVASTLDGSVNLAAMDWEDFEHLIREVFEKEFSSNGGEVRVTQASRDGGVDAVAFDPDPIRGGKIVIQAKRYTNTVGVSAVRDLYGTVLNEGATKGILVTTSDYGPDSYSFANGKPLVLLSGANLLHMLEKHGHSARIDIREAKRLASN